MSTTDEKAEAMYAEFVADPSPWHGTAELLDDNVNGYLRPAHLYRLTPPARHPNGGREVEYVVVGERYLFDQGDRPFTVVLAADRDGVAQPRSAMGQGAFSVSRPGLLRREIGYEVTA